MTKQIVQNFVDPDPALAVHQLPGQFARGNPALAVYQADATGPAVLVHSAGTMIDMQTIPGVSKFSVDGSGNVTSNGAALTPPTALAPSGALAETMPRNGAATTKTAGNSATAYANGIALAAGMVVSNISLTTGSTPESGGSHGWYALCDSGLVVRAVTADQTGAAVWGANAELKLALAAPYTVPASGMYFAVVCVVASGMPTFLGGGAIGVLAGIAPQMMGASSTGLSTPPVVGTSLTAFSGVASTIANFYAYVS